MNTCWNIFLIPRVSGFHICLHPECLSAERLSHLITLMDHFEGKNGQDEKEIHSVEVQANATESLFELYAQREAKKEQLPVSVAVWGSSTM